MWRQLRITHNILMKINWAISADDWQRSIIWWMTVEVHNALLLCWIFPNISLQAFMLIHGKIDSKLEIVPTISSGFIIILEHCKLLSDGWISKTCFDWMQSYDYPQPIIVLTGKTPTIANSKIDLRPFNNISMKRWSLSTRFAEII